MLRPIFRLQLEPETTDNNAVHAEHLFGRVQVVSQLFVPGDLGRYTATGVVATT